MYELSRTIPNAQVLLAMEPEELGAKILFLLRKRSEQSREPFLFSNLIGELWPRNYPYMGGQHEPYPQERQDEINLALSEAWAWLVAQGLLVEAPGQHGGADWRVLSRRARRFEDESEFARFAVAHMLPKEALHPRISNKAWSAFMRSEFDVAVFQAMKAVEVATREAASLSNDLIGVKLMRRRSTRKTVRSQIWRRRREREKRAPPFSRAQSAATRTPTRTVMYTLATRPKQSRLSCWLTTFFAS
jgi:hypothetical protein